MAATKTFSFNFPDEILTQIFKNCSFDTLFHVMQANQAFYRKYKLHELSGWSIDKDLSVDDDFEQQPDYKEICKRFCAIFGTSLHADSTGRCLRCIKCNQLCCDLSCISERDEMIIFDFGSKTTWFKYASDTTGQLSMHPTIGPIASLESGSDDVSSEFCPVCSRLALSRLPQAPGAGAASSGAADMCDFSTQNNRFSRAFSKLSLKNLNCLNGQAAERGFTDDDETVNYLLEASNSCSRSTGHLKKVTSSDELNSRCAVVPSQAKEKSSDGPSTDCIVLSPKVALGREVLSETSLQLGIYKFLIRHMLKRNPFFQVHNISFAICEPHECDDVMKRAFIELLLCELKVPGLCFVPKPIGIALYTGLDTCLVIDSGANHTVISPVVNLTVLSECVRSVNIGGSLLTRRLLDFINSKGLDMEVKECSIDSSQVKRECYLAYNPEVEVKRKIAQRDIVIKGSKDNKPKLCEVRLSHELYQLSEDMYLHLNLHERIISAISSLDFITKRHMISNIVLTGGNCRLAGLSLRLTLDLQKHLPAELSGLVHVIDPRLMTGRSDAVIGASYIKKWPNVKWITRRNYIIGGCNMENCAVDSVADCSSFCTRGDYSHNDNDDGTLYSDVCNDESVTSATLLFVDSDTRQLLPRRQNDMAEADILDESFSCELRHPSERSFDNDDLYDYVPVINNSDFFAIV